MAEGFADPAEIKGYHAHIYYDPAKTKTEAARLRGRRAAWMKTTAGRATVELPSAKEDGW